MSLLESLIAFVILALVSVAVIAVSSQSTLDAKALKTHYYAGLVADNELILAQLTHPVLRQPISGESMLMGETWFWTIHPTKTQQGELQQWKIQVFNEAERQHSVTDRISYVAIPKE